MKRLLRRLMVGTVLMAMLAWLAWRWSGPHAAAPSVEGARSDSADAGLKAVRASPVTSYATLNRGPAVFHVTTSARDNVRGTFWNAWRPSAVHRVAGLD